MLDSEFSSSDTLIAQSLLQRSASLASRRADAATDLTMTKVREIVLSRVFVKRTSFWPGKRKIRAAISSSVTTWLQFDAGTKPTSGCPPDPLMTPSEEGSAYGIIIQYLPAAIVSGRR